VLNASIRSFRHAAFSADGRMFAAADADTYPGQNRGTTRVCVWEVVSWRERVVFDYAGQVEALAFAPDGRSLALGGARQAEREAPRTVALWDLDDGKARVTLEGHRTGIQAVAFRADGRLLATGGADGVLKLWDVRSGRELGSPGRRVDGLTSLSFSPDGRLLAAGSYHGTVRLFAVETDD
jgi:WD40 repeat protein